MTTRLDVLNHLLGVIGETPVSSDQSNHPSVLSAMVQINRVSKELQSRGWWFNTEYDLVLQPNEAGHIIIPAGTLFVAPIAPFSRLTRRGGKLYDPERHTFVIGQAVTVNVVVQLDIEDLPETAALYVQHKAAYDFYVNDDGDETKSNRLEKQANTAWGFLRADELKALRTNANYRPASAFLRYRMKQQGASYNPNYLGGR